MKKIVINTKYGGFGLSHEAIMRWGELRKHNLVFKENYGYVSYHMDGMIEGEELNVDGIDRDDFALVKAVEELGEKANGKYANLKVVEIPDDVECWTIGEYDGQEWVAECHRKWF